MQKEGEAGILELRTGVAVRILESHTITEGRGTGISGTQRLGFHRFGERPQWPKQKRREEITSRGVFDFHSRQTEDRPEG